MNYLIIMAAVLAVAFLLILPLKLAAATVCAGRTGAGWCFLALLTASVAQTIGLSFPVWGSCIAFLLAAVVFAAILQTTFVRGIAIALLHGIFSVMLLVLLLTALGVGAGAISTLGH